MTVVNKLIIVCGRVVQGCCDFRKVLLRILDKARVLHVAARAGFISLEDYRFEMQGLRIRASGLGA